MANIEISENMVGAMVVLTLQDILTFIRATHPDVIAVNDNLENPEDFTDNPEVIKTAKAIHSMKIAQQDINEINPNLH